MGLLSWDQTLASKYIKNSYILVGLYYQISQILCCFILGPHIFYFRNYFNFQILKLHKVWVCKKIKSYSQHKFNPSVWLQSSWWIIHHLSKTLRLYLSWDFRHGSVFKARAVFVNDIDLIPRTFCNLTAICIFDFRQSHFLD